MKARPILGSTPVIQSLLSDRKKLTRRTTGLDLVNEYPGNWKFIEWVPGKEFIFKRLRGKKEHYFKCPYGAAGDLLWFRETWKVSAHYPDNEKWLIEFKAGGTAAVTRKKSPKLKQLKNWQPSIFMEKDIARIWVKIKSINIERLRDISHTDALEEGVEYVKKDDGNFYFKNYLKDNSFQYKVEPIKSFKSLWQSINGINSWKNNPWVWIIEFEKYSPKNKKA